MRIVTADEIVAAFEKTGLVPKQGRYFDIEHKCGCALGALFAHEHGIEDYGPGDALEWIDGNFDFEDRRDITLGFDGQRPVSGCSWHSANYLAGREAAKRLGLPVEE